MSFMLQTTLQVGTIFILSILHISKLKPRREMKQKGVWRGLGVMVVVGLWGRWSGVSPSNTCRKT